MEGVRARGHARPRRQLRGRVLDREPRPDGRAHRRLDHRRAGADAERRRVPGDARRVVRVHPAHRRRDRRLEHPVRREPAQRRPRRDRDEPARVAQLRARRRKATGFPIAKIAARLAVGYTLDEIPNDITKKTPASFEPTIDYVVTKVPRWAFEKLPGFGGGARHADAVRRRSDVDRPHVPGVACRRACARSSTAASGSTAIRASRSTTSLDDDELVRRAAIATPDRAFHLEAALRRGITVERLAATTMVDPWFLDQILAIVEERAALGRGRLRRHDAAAVAPRQAPRVRRRAAGVSLGHERRRGPPVAASSPASIATFKTVDTCGAEFDADTPYHYSTYEDESEVRAERRAQDRDPRQRSQPHRPGHRVRLLLRARQLRPARRRLRDDHGQLQPRDGVDRLRHVATGCTSSRSPKKTSSTSSTPSSPKA